MGMQVYLDEDWLLQINDASLQQSQPDRLKPTLSQYSPSYHYYCCSLNLKKIKIVRAHNFYPFCLFVIAALLMESFVRLVQLTDEALFFHKNIGISLLRHACLTFDRRLFGQVRYLHIYSSWAVRHFLEQEFNASSGFRLMNFLNINWALQFVSIEAQKYSWI